jgi:hypothetical protein
VSPTPPYGHLASTSESTLLCSQHFFSDSLHFCLLFPLRLSPDPHLQQCQ